MENSGFVVNWSTTFDGIKIYDEILRPTRWTLQTDIMLSDECKEEEFDILLSKVRWWFQNVIHESIFVSAKNSWAINNLLGNTNNNVVLLPEQPADDMIALALHTKMMALGQDKLIFGVTDLSNDNVDRITYSYSGDLQGLLPQLKDWMPENYWFNHPWWHRDDGTTIDIPPVGGDLSEKPSWHFDLNTITQAYSDSQNSGESGQVIYPSSFNPQVIQGGKSE